MEIQRVARTSACAVQEKTSRAENAAETALLRDDTVLSTNQNTDDRGGVESCSGPRFPSLPNGTVSDGWAKRHGLWCRVKAFSLRRSGSNGERMKLGDENEKANHQSTRHLRLRGRHNQKHTPRAFRFMRAERELKKQAKQLENQIAALTEWNQTLIADVSQRDEKFSELQRRLRFTEAKLEKSKRESAKLNCILELAKLQGSAQQEVLDGKQDDVIKMATRQAELYEQIRKLKLTIETLRNKLERSEAEHSENGRARTDGTAEHPTSITTTSRNAAAAARLQDALNVRQPTRQRAGDNNQSSSEPATMADGERATREEKQKWRRRIHKMRLAKRVMAAGKLRVKQQRARNIALRVDLKNKATRIRELLDERSRIQQYLMDLREAFEANVENIATDAAHTSTTSTMKTTRSEDAAVGISTSDALLRETEAISSKLESLECFLGGDESFEDFVKSQQRGTRNGETGGIETAAQVRSTDEELKQLALRISRWKLKRAKTSENGTTKVRLARRISRAKLCTVEVKGSRRKERRAKAKSSGRGKKNGAQTKCGDEDSAQTGRGVSKEGVADVSAETEKENSGEYTEGTTADKEENQQPLQRDSRDIQSNKDGDEKREELKEEGGVAFKDGSDNVTGGCPQSCHDEREMNRDFQHGTDDGAQENDAPSAKIEGGVPENEVPPDDVMKVQKEQNVLRRVSDLLVDKWCLEGQVKALADNEQALSAAKREISGRLDAAHRELARSLSDTGCRKKKSSIDIDVGGEVALLRQQVADLSRQLREMNDRRAEEGVLNVQIQAEADRWKEKASALEATKGKLEDEVKGWMETVMEVRQGRMQLLNQMDDMAEKFGKLELIGDRTRSKWLQTNRKGCRAPPSSIKSYRDDNDASNIQSRFPERDSMRVSELEADIEALSELRKIQDEQIEQLSALLQKSNDEKQALMVQLEEEQRERRYLQADVDLLIDRE